MTSMNTPDFEQLLHPSISIYIPRIPSSITEEYVVRMFSLHVIGDVRRVDFAPINKLPGFGEHDDAPFCCAFVHFNHFYNTLTTQQIINVLNNENGCYHFYYDASNIYWILVKNHRPIPDTVMNKHQIVENARVLERQMKQQSFQIEKQQQIISEQMGYIDKMQNVLYILLSQSFPPEQAEGYYTYLKVPYSDQMNQNFISEENVLFM